MIHDNYLENLYQLLEFIAEENN